MKGSTVFCNLLITALNKKPVYFGYLSIVKSNWGLTVAIFHRQTEKHCYLCSYGHKANCLLDYHKCFKVGHLLMSFSSN